MLTSHPVSARLDRLVVAGVRHVLFVTSNLVVQEACFVDPLTGDPVCEAGDKRVLTVECLAEYVHLVGERWFGSGIKKQMEAFREGFSEVFPFGSLQILSALELGVMLCGERKIEWDRASLEKNLKLVCNEQVLAPLLLLSLASVHG